MLSKTSADYLTRPRLSAVMEVLSWLNTIREEK
jgi:hypothetical protein